MSDRRGRSWHRATTGRRSWPKTAPGRSPSRAIRYRERREDRLHRGRAPPACDASDGTSVMALLGWSSRSPSYETNTNIRSRCDRPAEHAAEVVLVFLRLRQTLSLDEIVRRIERVVAEVLEHRAMELVGAGTRHDGDLPAGRPAEFRRVGRGLDPEFLHRVDRHQAVGPALGAQARCRSGAGGPEARRRLNADVRAHAIDREVVRVGALAVDAELARTARARRRQHDAGRHRDQRLKAAAVERDVLDELPIDHRADRRRRVHPRRVRGHRHRCIQPRHLEQQLHVDRVADVQHDLRDLRGDESRRVRRSAGIGRAAEAEATNVPCAPQVVDRCRPVLEIDDGDANIRDDRRGFVDDRA